MENKEENKKESVNKTPIRNRRSLILIEFVLWVVIVCLVYLKHTNDIFAPNFDTISFTIMIGSIPILVKLIFDKFPFELIRSTLKEGDSLITEILSDSFFSLAFVKEKKNAPNSVERNENLKIKLTESNQTKLIELVEKINELNKVEKSIKGVLMGQIQEATKIAEKIYTRTGVYLLVGCLIAFVGVFIFYSPMFNSAISEDKEPLVKFIDFLPRIGALFFVEYVAFFFLKQYRIMMEEYRYYEAIKRKKQDNFLIVNLVESYRNEEIVLKQILDKCSFEEIDRKLGKDDSTEVLKAQQLTNEDFNLIENMMDLVREIKRK